MCDASPGFIPAKAICLPSGDHIGVLEKRADPTIMQFSGRVRGTHCCSASPSDGSLVGDTSPFGQQAL